MNKSEQSGSPVSNRDWRVSCVLGVLLGLCVGCSTALPNEPIDKEVKSSLSRVQGAAAEIESASEQCSALAKKNEALVIEARRILADAQAAEARCSKRLARIPKQCPVCKAVPAVTPVPGEKSEEKKTESGEWSPSDAPRK